MVKSRYIGDGRPPTSNRNPYNWYIKPYYWVDFSHPLLYGNVMGVELIDPIAIAHMDPGFPGNAMTLFISLCFKFDAMRRIMLLQLVRSSSGGKPVSWKRHRGSDCKQAWYCSAGKEISMEKKDLCQVLPFVTFLGVLFVTSSGAKTWPPFGESVQVTWKKLEQAIE